MEFDEVRTALAFLVLFGLIAVGTVASPMQTSTVAMVLGGLFVFGVLVLALGVRHGEYRAGTD